MNDETSEVAEELPLEEQLRLAREEIVALTAARDFEREHALRALAEAQNTRTRLEREKAEAVAYAASAFARDMLVVADNLERALAALPAEPDVALKPLVSGLEAVKREMLHVFERHGIRRVESVGLPLDPMQHQAMVEVESEAEPGTVVAELQSGWLLKDRLLRPALVSVAKAS
ncbi:nucleotide exchange factor GrpE [Thermaurantiacus sp.]